MNSEEFWSGMTMNIETGTLIYHHSTYELFTWLFTPLDNSDQILDAI